ncbi:MAG: hypothetical protein E6J45_11135 [Chloroflexi bacterium]|nr:MAG: hypothetical protein E6J45_11135 [Chloroflexota bacterium]
MTRRVSCWRVAGRPGSTWCRCSLPPAPTSGSNWPAAAPEGSSTWCRWPAARVRGYTSLPLLVGFGISSPDSARAVMEAGADGVIIGSKAIEVSEQGGAKALEAFVREIAAAL